MGRDPMDLEVRLPCHAGAPATARHVIAEFDDVLPLAMIERAMLLVSELVTNSVRHAGACDAIRLVVHVGARDRRLRVEVRDRGRGFDPAELAGGSPAAGAGFGLAMVDALADRWGVDQASSPSPDGQGRPPRTTAVWFELAAQKNGSPSRV